MPLHLLSKKSWNVYAPDNIARVKRDQAAARAREEEEDRRLQEQDSADRLAVLRGEGHTPPSQDKRSAESRESHGEDRRKRRRLDGEDDTERDIRPAREERQKRHRGHHQDRGRLDVPTTDRSGHINLFPMKEQGQGRHEKNSEVEVEKARKQHEREDQYTMRLSNAAGKNLDRSGPWYASSKRHTREDMDFVEGKDVWGTPDPAAKDREQFRQASNDPLAFMQRAQTQLKQAERDKQRWRSEEQDETSRRSAHIKREHGRSRPRSRERQSTHHGARSHREHAKRNGRSRHKSGTPHLEDRRQHKPVLPDVPDDFKLETS